MSWANAMEESREWRTSDGGDRMGLGEMVTYLAVMGPFAFGIVWTVVSGNPLWLIMGLVPAFIRGRIDASRAIAPDATATKYRVPRRQRIVPPAPQG